VTIAAIPDDLLRKIAAESEVSRKERQRLENEISILRRALQRCQHEAGQLKGNQEYLFLFLLSIVIISLTRNSDIYNLPAADSLQSGDTNNEGENRAVTSAAVVNDPPEDSTSYRPFDTSSTGLCDISGQPFFSADPFPSASTSTKSPQLTPPDTPVSETNSSLGF
jgi:hypothetical protein